MAYAVPTADSVQLVDSYFSAISCSLRNPENFHIENSHFSASSETLRGLATLDQVPSQSG